MSKRNGELKTEDVMVRMTPSMRRDIDRLADKNHRPTPAEIRLAIEKHLKGAR